MQLGSSLERPSSSWTRRGFIEMVGAGSAAMLLPGCATASFNSVQVDLSALEARHGGRLGACAFDSARRRRVGWRPGERFAYCSTFKLFLAAAVLERVARGEERLDRRIAIDAADIIVHAPTTGSAVGTSLTVAQLLEGMVTVSDNPAANIMIREIGGLDVLRSWYRLLGDQVTRVDRLEPELNSALPGDPKDTTTPDQAVNNLFSLFGGDRLHRSHRDLLLGWMIASPTGPGRIKAGVSADAVVAHKTGTGFDGPTNDIGLVWTPNRPPIYLAIYFAGTPNAASAEREAIVADTTAALLDALSRS